MYNDSPVLRLHGLAPESIVDGPGLRFAVFAQGCPHCCPGCHNPASHDANGGYTARAAELWEAFCENPLLAGITLSGGEPFAQPAPLLWLARLVKSRGGAGKSVMTYSGYTLEELRRMAAAQPDVHDLLDVTDILVDGPYVQALRDLELPWRGSANQRVWLRQGDDFVPHPVQNGA